MSFIAAFIVIIVCICLLFFILPVAHSPMQPQNVSSREGTKAVFRGSSSVFLAELGDKTSFALGEADTYVNVNHKTSHDLPSFGSVQSSSSIVDFKNMKASEFALVQFDSRPLLESTYWRSSAEWNQHYCDLHGHVFIYYTFSELGDKKCHSKDNKYELADAWCKVKAMLKANEDYPDVKLFIYMDSDAVLDHKFEETSLQTITTTVQSKLDWDVLQKPMVFNQDGPCWWCSMIEKKGYKMCLNAGTVLWYRHEYSLAVLNEWWGAALDSYDDNPIKRKFRTSWPWEQDRQMAVYHRSNKHIQVASQPDKPFMHMQHGHNKDIEGGGGEGWCLSHLARSGCFISHYCEDKQSKKRMMEKYSLLNANEGKRHGDAMPSTFKIDYL